MSEHEALTGLRVPVHDSQTGALQFTLTAGRAERAGRLGLRFRATDVTVVLEPSTERPWGRTTFHAPTGDIVMAVPAGREGPVLELMRDGNVRLERLHLEGTVTATLEASSTTVPATRITTESVTIGVDERSGTPIDFQAPKPVDLIGPGLSLHAASATTTPDGVWVLHGPVEGRFTSRDARQSPLRTLPRVPIRLEKFGEERIELHTDGDVRVELADGARTVIAPQRTVLGARRVDGGELVGVLVAGALRATLETPERQPARISAIDATHGVRWVAFSGELRPDAFLWADRVQVDQGGEGVGRLVATGRTTMVMRAGASLARPGKDPLAVPTAPKLAEAAYYVASDDRLEVSRADAKGAVHVVTTGESTFATVGAAERHAAVWLPLRPFPAHRALRRMADEVDAPRRAPPAPPGRAAMALRAPAVDATITPGTTGDDRIDWTLPAGGFLELNGGPGRWQRFRALRGSGTFTGRRNDDAPDPKARRWWDVEATFPEWLQGAALVNGPGGRRRLLRVVRRGQSSSLTVTRTGIAANAESRIRVTNGATLMDLRVPEGWDPAGANAPQPERVGLVHAQEVVIETKGTTGFVHHVLAAGGVEAELPTRVEGEPGETAVLKGNRLEGWREQQSDGALVERWQWKGFKEARSPAAAAFDLGGGPWTLPGSPTEEWRFSAEDGELTRVSGLVGKRRVRRGLTINAPNAATLRAFPRGARADATPVGRLLARALQLGFGPSPTGAARLVQLRAAGGAVYEGRSATAGVVQCAADTITMRAGPWRPAKPYAKWAETWELRGAPATIRLPANRPLPLFPTRTPPSADVVPLVVHEARGDLILLRRFWASPTDALPSREEVWFPGKAILEQWNARAVGQAPSLEWRLQAGALKLARSATERRVLASNHVSIRNFDANENIQGTVTCPELAAVVELDDVGAPRTSHTTFGAPFVATGFTAKDAYARLGKPGGQEPAGGSQVRLIAPRGASVRREAAASTTVLDADPLYLQFLDRKGLATRTFKTGKGIRISETAAGRWRLAVRAGQVATPLSAAEAKDLENMSRTR